MPGKTIRPILVLLALVTVVAHSPALADAVDPGLYTITGTVTDAFGSPLEGAEVREGPNTAVTDADGRYQLSGGTGGSYTLRASRTGTTTESETVSLLVPGETVVDFELFYLNTVVVEPDTVTTADGPSNIAVIVRTFAPNPGVPGDSGGNSCAVLHDGRTDALAPMTFVGTDTSWGHTRAQWEATVLLAALTTEGRHELTAEVRDCASGKRVTLSSGHGYVIDNTDPNIGVPSPLGWSTVSPRLSLPVGDNGGSGLDATLSSLFLDGVPLEIVPDYSAGQFSARALGLLPGVHTAHATVSDRAGNASQSAWSFTVDGASPRIEEVAPRSTSDLTPLITARAVDNESGVDPASIEMTLLYFGGIPVEVTPTYDPDTGAIAYQVDRPLPVGDHEVVVRVADRAGYEFTRGWKLTVRAV